MASDDHDASGLASVRLCRGAAAGLFDTDAGDVGCWARAAALCDRCPVLSTCRGELNRAFPGWGPGRRRANPSSVVWAGAIFSPDRRLWTRHGLTRHVAARAARERHAHPSRAGRGPAGPAPQSVTVTEAP